MELVGKWMVGISRAGWKGMAGIGRAGRKMDGGNWQSWWKLIDSMCKFAASEWRAY